MKTTAVGSLACVALLLPFTASQAGDLSSPTAFTYQGRLEDEGKPADANYAFLVRLFNGPGDAEQIGGDFCADLVPVVHGLFTLSLDFGSVFAGDAPRYLEIRVLEDGDCSDTTEFIRLFPRQRITATPLALQALSANVAVQAESAGLAEQAGVAELADAALRLDAPDGSPTSAVFVDNNGNVGIGTTSPQTRLHVNGVLQWGASNTNIAFSGEDAFGLYLEQSGNSPARSAIRLQTSKSGDLGNYSQFFIDPNSGFAFTTVGTGNGRVGIGTRTPQAALDVRGDIRLGPSGEFRASSSAENLRIVRGSVFSNGGSSLGAGFSSVRAGTGQYTITFNPPFSDRPVVTASVVGAVGIYANIASNSSSQASVFTISRIDSAGNADASFHFIAIGPR